MPDTRRGIDPELIEKIVIVVFDTIASHYPAGTPEQIWNIMDCLFKIDTSEVDDLNEGSDAG